MRYKYTTVNISKNIGPDMETYIIVCYNIFREKIRVFVVYPIVYCDKSPNTHTYQQGSVTVLT
jgi:hypothetical protein